MSRLLKKLHKPCDDLTKYDNEPYMKNPLLKLKMSEVRQFQIRSSLQNRAIQVRQFSRI
jgi:dynein heavy chain